MGKILDYDDEYVLIETKLPVDDDPTMLQVAEVLFARKIVTSVISRSNITVPVNAAALADDAKRGPEKKIETP